MILNSLIHCHISAASSSNHLAHTQCGDSFHIGPYLILIYPNDSASPHTEITTGNEMDLVHHISECGAGVLHIVSYSVHNPISGIKCRG